MIKRELRVNDRIRVLAPIDYDIVIIPIGSMGTVTNVMLNLCDGDLGVEIRLDKHIPQLWNWDNTILLIPPELSLVSKWNNNGDTENGPDDVGKTNIYPIARRGRSASTG